MTINKRKILITGVCGSIGIALLAKIITEKKFDNYDIIGIDKDENKLFFLNEKYIKNKRIKLYLCDIRNEISLNDYLNKVDIIYHTAALKHVGITELSPYEAIQTNIIGTNNLIRLSEQNKVKKFIFCSTDKAVNPTNVMGASKLMAEKLLTSAVAKNGSFGTIFTTIRFGNVMGSAGSVFQIFRNQIKNNMPITITDKNMTRFVMSISEATKYIIEISNLAIGGEVFVPKMPSLKITSLADALIKMGCKENLIKKIFIGPKPGEKMYEELVGIEEMRRTIEIKNYYVILPAFSNLFPQINNKYIKKKSMKIKSIYNSETAKSLNCSEIIEFIKKNKIT